MFSFVYAFIKMEELQDLVRRHHFWNNKLRTNIGESAPSRWAGKRLLLEPVLSNSVHGAGRTKNQARMLELVREMLPDVGEPLMLTLNKQVTCARHRDGKNASDFSYNMFFDGDVPFTGGELIVEEPTGDRVLSEKNDWHKLCGRDHFHYNLPHTGTKLSIVAYSQNGKPERKSGSAVGKGLRRTRRTHERQ